MSFSVLLILALDVGSWREQSPTLELISASSNGLQLNLTEGGRAERVEASFVSASYFDLLGVRPALGRSFEPAEEDRTSPQASCWRSRGSPSLSAWRRRWRASCST